VQLETASTRAQLADKEKHRIQLTLDESKERIKDLESRLARVSGELVVSQTHVNELQHSLQVGVPPQQSYLQCCLLMCHTS
jgi:chromosome segregation ATPase